MSSPEFKTHVENTIEAQRTSDGEIQALPLKARALTEIISSGTGRRPSDSDIRYGGKKHPEKKQKANIKKNNSFTGGISQFFKPLEVKEDEFSDSPNVTRASTGSVAGFQVFVERTLKHYTKIRGRKFKDAHKKLVPWSKTKKIGNWSFYQDINQVGKQPPKPNMNLDMLTVCLEDKFEAEMFLALKKCNFLYPMGSECNELIHQSNIVLEQVKEVLAKSLFRFMFQSPPEKIKNDDVYLMALAERLVVLAINILKYEDYHKSANYNEDKYSVDDIYGVQVDIHDQLNNELIKFIQKEKDNILDKIRNPSIERSEESKNDDDVMKSIRNLVASDISIEVKKFDANAREQLAKRVECYIDYVLPFIQEKRNLQELLKRAEVYKDVANFKNKHEKEYNAKNYAAVEIKLHKALDDLLKLKPLTQKFELPSLQFSIAKCYEYLMEIDIKQGKSEDIQKYFELAHDIFKQLSFEDEQKMLEEKYATYQKENKEPGQHDISQSTASSSIPRPALK